MEQIIREQEGTTTVSEIHRLMAQMHGVSVEEYRQMEAANLAAFREMMRG